MANSREAEPSLGQSDNHGGQRGSGRVSAPTVNQQPCGLPQKGEIKKAFRVVSERLDNGF